MVRRFVEEAQIGGQLQHPGIVPIYELGTFADLRPFFAMKLVKGHTLAQLLDARDGPDDDRPRFLSIFEAIAQTVAYAHARGVIHRDLKPSNVMVGSFGEVQVMDWGLAKVLPRGGMVDDAQAGKSERQETVIATARSGSDSPGLSRPGSAMGTPAYMAPEQARGEGERVDERADVFALGSILCEVLTGQPAFLGRSSGEIMRKAALGDLADATARLGACGADAELIAIAGDCLAREPEDRPRHAGAVAERVTAYLGGVQDRLRTAEVARAAESARAEEAVHTAAEANERARVDAPRPAVPGGAGGLAAGADHRGRAQLDVPAPAAAAGAARFAQVLAEATALRDRASREAGDPAAWRDALAALERAEVQGPEVEVLRDEIQAGRKEAERDVRLRQELVEVRANQYDVGTDGTDVAYATAFRDAGLDLDALEPAEFARRLRRQPEAAVVELSAFLDDWSAVRRAANRPVAAWRRPLEAARLADPDPYRDRLRTILLAEDRKPQAEALMALAAAAEAAELPAPTAVLLGKTLADVGQAEAAVALLRAAAGRHPGDVWVNYVLAWALDSLRPSAREEAVRYYTAARAVRPETAPELAHLLERMGRSVEAETVFRDLTDRRPENARHLGCLAIHLKERGRAADAAPFLDRAVAAYRTAIRLKPDYAWAHSKLGVALAGQGKVDEAVAAYRTAIRLKPDDAIAHSNLGRALAAQGKLDEAVAAYRTAIRLQPDFAVAHANLGVALVGQGKLDEAVTEYRSAIRLKPDYAEAHCDLGHLLRGQGDYAGAVAMLRRGHDLGTRQPGWRYPSARWVADAERMAALTARLPAVLKGEDRPKDVADRLAIAQMCYDTKRFAAAARFWAEALAADPKLGDDRQAQHRYNAACAAALAAAGQGTDDPKPDDAARARLRGQALDWLKDERAAWVKLLDAGGPQARPLVQQTLEHWRADTDLAGVRDPDPLAKLPESERRRLAIALVRGRRPAGPGPGRPALSPSGPDRPRRPLQSPGPPPCRPAGAAGRPAGPPQPRGPARRSRPIGRRAADGTGPGRLTVSGRSGLDLAFHGDIITMP